MSSGGSFALRLALAGALCLCARAAGASAAGGSAASATAGVSWASAKDAWETRETGVFATETAGQSWHRIYSQAALTVLRLSATSGVIELGVDPGPCMCTTRKLWTDDDGETWHPTDAIGTSFAGAGDSLYWWEGGDLHLISPFPPPDSGRLLDAKLLTSVPSGTIVAATETPNGFVFLVSSRVGGQHWDTNPRVLLATGADVQTVQLPAAPAGELLAEGIEADAGSLTVTATDFGSDPVATVTWTSTDAGQTWSLDP